MEPLCDLIANSLNKMNLETKSKLGNSGGNFFDNLLNFLVFSQPLLRKNQLFILYAAGAGI